MWKKSNNLIVSYFLVHLSLPWLCRLLKSLWKQSLPPTTLLEDTKEFINEKNGQSIDVDVEGSEHSTIEKGLLSNNSTQIPIEMTTETSTQQVLPSQNEKPNNNKTEIKEIQTPEGESCSSCLNSVSHIDRHIIICDTTEWAKKIEKENGTFPQLLYNSIQNAKEVSQSTLELKVTACQESNDSLDHVKILVYPENLQFRISRTNIEEIQSFAQLMVTPAPIMTSEINTIFNSSPIPWKKLILVCIHASRDKRCGRAGPLVISELQAELERRGIHENQIAVRGSSHIGGHKFAGTLVVYPTGQWYGYVTPKVIPELLNSLERGEILNRCFRGYSNTQQQMNW